MSCTNTCKRAHNRFCLKYLPLSLVWFRVEACVFVGAVPRYPAWYIAYVPLVRTLRERERHIEYVLSDFLGVGVELWEMITVIDGLYMHMLGVLLSRRQVVHLTLQLRNPYFRAQVRVVLLRMGEPALLRGGCVFPHCCNQFWQFGPSDLIVEFRVMRTGFGLSATTSFGNSKFGSNQRVGKDYIILIGEAHHRTLL